jgi:hypothetical protein
MTIINFLSLIKKIDNIYFCNLNKKMLVYIEIIKQIEIAKRINKLSKEDLENSRGNYEITRRNICQSDWYIKFLTEIKEYIENQNNEIERIKKMIK